jgi:hypothetical protein
MPDTKRCFVISPIGAPGSKVRDDADAVLEYIIKPALREMEIEAIRADKLAEPGLITEQMIAAIMDYDFCIADLSGHNPNVFYELALAQAAERRVILLKQAGDLIPFDVKDHRLIEYDLSARSMKTDKWIPVLQEQVKSVLAPGYQPPKLLRGRSVSKSEGSRSYLINARSEEFGDAPRYHEVVQRADKYCCLMGVSLKSWGSDDGRRVLQDLNRRRVPVRVLLMDAENPGLAAMINEHLPSEDLGAVKRQTSKMAEYFNGIARESATFKVTRLREGLPHFQLVLTEDTALVLQYMFFRGTGDSPLQQFPGGSQLYQVFLDEFEKLWELNAARATSTPRT